ncbi:MAG: alpha/beta fold hydrolase [Alphaproteobacteria bacterium]|nr:alpha/beta fold hydrolase [Alphaproteobacteria bacterium]
MRGMAAAFAALLLGACTPALEPRGPEIQPARLTGDAFEMPDGAKLPYRTWPSPSGAPKAVVLAIHGFNDHSRAWTMPAEAWAKQGITTYAYDQRGFGRAPHPGIWSGTDALVDDLADALKLVRAHSADAPVFVAGESMGGAVAMVAMARGRLQGAAGTILVAPAVRGRSTLMFFERWFLALLYRTVPGIAPSVQAPGIQPSDNIEMMRELSADPLFLKRTRVDTLNGLFDLMDESLASAPRITAPTLILIGTQDTLVPSGPMSTMLAGLPPAPPADRTVITYPAGYHMLLRDRQRARAIDDVANWILARTAPR